jgi:hypothetical protein
MSQWSKNAAQRYAEKRDAELKALRDRNDIDLRAPDMWRSISGIVARKCREFNSEPGTGNVLFFDGIEPYKIKVIRTDTHQRVTIAFTERLYSITIDGPRDQEKFDFQPISGTSEVGLFDSNGQQLAMEDFASATVDLLLE